MLDAAKGYNLKQASFKNLIFKEECFDQAMELCLHMHAMVHGREVSEIGEETFEDKVWDGLEEPCFYTMPTPKDVTVAWNLWHITRIEDLTVNLLIAGEKQVLDGDWADRLNTWVTDTGNAMSDEEILALSTSFDPEQLRLYRRAVGERTRQVLAGLTPQDVRRKVPPRDLARVAEEGGVTDHPDSRWLLDFWGKKNVAGLLAMPVTRHQVGHLNDCMKLKEKCRRLFRE